MSKLIFGCGYLGSRVAALWRDAGHEVVVVTRSQKHADEFQRIGYRAIVADVTRPETLRDLPTAETVLYAVGYDRSPVGGPSIEAVYAGGVRNVLEALAGNEPSPTPSRKGRGAIPEPFPGPSLLGRGSMLRFIYVSTTGVYGKGSGEWIDEATLPDPQRDGGKASLAAERELASHPLGAHGVILRLAGIYGPERVPFLDKLRNAEPIPARATGFLNLIHVDDAAAIVGAAANVDWETVVSGSVVHDSLVNSMPGPRVYCVSDGTPVARGDYYSEVARQISAPSPTFTDIPSNTSRYLRAASNRRISNMRMLADLRVTLKYPDYQIGLAAILNS